MTGGFGLGDVLRAFRALEALDDDERRAIARLLGFDLAPVAVPIAKPDPNRTIASPPFAVTTAEQTRRTPPDEREASPTEIVRLPDIVFEPIELPPALPRPAPTAPPPPVPASLFASDWASTIVARLGARMAPVGPFDLARLIEQVARCEPIRAVPRRLRLATAPSLTVVIDVGGVMAWLADDQRALVEHLRGLSRAPVDVVIADGAPPVTDPSERDTGAGDDDDDDGASFAVAAAHSARVIALTGLGGGSPWSPPARDRVERWRAFADDLAARGATLLVLTPYPPARRPPTLGDLRCVHWDRHTRPSEVHALVRGLR